MGIMNTIGMPKILTVALLFIIDKSHQECVCREGYIVSCTKINQTCFYHSICYGGYRNNYNLRINDSNFEVLPSTCLTGLNFLQLYLGHSNLAKIATGVFDQQRSLKVIDLEYNKLKAIKDSIFRNQVEMQNLSLQYNHIEEIADHAFVGLVKLVRLLLNNNILRKIPNNLFDPLEVLEYLDLSNNQIESIDEILFLGNIRLKYIFLNNNRLKSLPDGLFKNNHFLTSIDVSQNPLIKPVDYTNLSYFKELSELGISSTDNSPVFILDRGSFRSLRKLQIDGNNISRIDIDFHPTLSSLSLSRNNMQSIDNSSFENCMNLQYLNLSSNKIDYITVNSFDHLIHLESLDLKSNKISTLDHGIFKNLTNLEYLDLSGNSLENISYGTLDPLKKLIFLNLNSNELSTLSIFMFHSLRKLEKLHLSDNNIAFLDGNELVSTLPALKTISLDNNLWTCSRLIKLVHILEKHSVVIDDGSIRHTHNINGIQCEDIITIEYDNKPHISNITFADNVKSNKLYDFFDVDFKNTNFYKFFMNLPSFEINTKPTAEKIVRTVQVNETTKDQYKEYQLSSANFNTLFSVCIFMLLASLTNILVLLYIFYRVKYSRLDTASGSSIELGSCAQFHT